MLDTKMENEKINIFCPQCNIFVETKVIGQGDAGINSKVLNPIDIPDAEYSGDIYLISICNKCSHPFLIKRSLYGVPAEFETITEEIVLYPEKTKTELHGLPKSIKNAHEQALRSYNASLYEPCVLMCRKSLEIVCKNFNAIGKNLYQKLESLKEMGNIDSRLLSWAHEIRSIGNDAAHEIKEEIDKDMAKDCLDFTEAILIYIFSLVERFENFKNRKKPKA